MKTIARSTLGLLGACTLAPLLPAQTTPTTPRVSDETRTGTTPPPQAATDGTAARFAGFATSSTTTQTAVANAQAAAAAARTGLSVATTDPTVARAVNQASAAVTQDGRAVRADLLAERQAALTRLRLAQTATDRERIVAELRTRTGQRMEEQRETARLVRDRLRELRDLTQVTPRPGGP